MDVNVMAEDEVIDELIEMERSMRMEDMNESTCQQSSTVSRIVEVDPEGNFIVVPYDHTNADSSEGEGYTAVIPTFKEVTVNTSAQDVVVPEESNVDALHQQNSEQEENGTEEAAEDEAGGDVTFVVEMNDEGAICSVDRSGVIPIDAEPHTYFPVTLPISKVKSMDNPLAGVKEFPSTRSRKTKPQAILYNDQVDEIYELLPNGTLNAIPSEKAFELAHSRQQNNHAEQQFEEAVVGEAVDVNDLASQLLPADIQQLENFLVTEQWKLQDSTSSHPNDSKKLTGKGAHSLDHTYTLPNASKTRITVVADGIQKHKKMLYNPHGGPMNVPTDIAGSDPEYQLYATSNWTPNAAYVSPTRSPSSVALEAAATSEGGISAAAAAANARRSQRQQEKVTRQEAERRLAENRQMLRREKEIFGPAPITSPVEAQRIVPTTLPAVLEVENTIATSTDEDSSPRRPYPKRQNRKLPAHLADPNYVNLDESEKKVSDDPQSQKESIPAGQKRKRSEETEAQEGDEETVANDDDPNKLWCICRKPHNNRFMICCDVCEEWFHGTCVGITKAQSHKFDKWNCRDCKAKKEGLKTPATVAARGGRGSAGSRGSVSADSSAASSGIRTESKSNAASAATPRNKNTSETVVQGTPISSRKRVSDGSGKVPPRTSQGENSQKRNPVVFGKRQRPPSVRVVTESAPAEIEQCSVCKTKPARKDSVFCSDECIIKHSQDTGSSTSTSNPAPSSPVKLKRANSKTVDKDEMENFLTFHVITPGSKSNVVVPPKVKEVAGINPKLPALKTPKKTDSTLDKSASEKKSEITSSTSVKRPSESDHSPALKKAKLAPPPSIPKRSVRPSTTSNTKSSSTSSSQRSSIASGDGKHTRSRLTSESKEGSSKSKAKDSDKQKEPEKQKELTESEIKDRRKTSKHSLTTVFESRLKQLPEAELAELPAANTPQELSIEIENELFQTFGDINQKYLNKLRSIIFNLKDPRNNLFKTIAIGDLKAKDLVKLESHQLASDELAQWRLNESKKELEMIKRSEIAKLEELKKQEKIDEELGFEKMSSVIAANEVRSLGITIAAPVEEKTEKIENVALGSSETKTATRSSSRHKSSSHHSSHSKSESSSRSRSDKNEKKSDSKHHHSTRSKNSHDKSGSSSSTSKHEKAEGDKRRHESSSSHGKHSSRSSPREKDSPKESARSLRSKEREHHRSSSSHHHHKRSDSKDKADKTGSTSRGSRSKEEKKHDSREKGDKTNADGTKTSREKDKPVIKQKSKDVNSVSAANEDNSNGSTIFSSDESRSPAASGTPSTVPADPIAIENPVADLRVSVDSSTTDNELPSSTIKTPDFTSEEANTLPSDLFSPDDQKPILTTKFEMPELGSFNACLYNVSHNSVDGIFFPESPVPIVGRITPNIVWDYIDKMKKSKEVIVLRLAPSTSADMKSYMTFFSYFSSRGRIAVLGGIFSPIKDVYLVPLEKHSPVNEALLPLNGPGLPKHRSHCLLAIVTRHSPEMAMAKKRKASAPIDSGKRMKFSTDIKPGLISSLNLNATREKRGTPLVTEPFPIKVSPKEEIKEPDDDDEPYTPWGEEEESTPGVAAVAAQVVETPVAVIPSYFQQMQMQELEAKIQEEQAAIQNIKMAMSGQGIDPVIPGLDGEFDSAAAVSAVPSFLRSPVPDLKTSTSQPTTFLTVPAISGPAEQQQQEIKKEDEEDDSAAYSPSQLEPETDDD